MPNEKILDQNLCTPHDIQYRLDLSTVGDDWAVATMSIEHSVEAKVL